MDRSCDLIELTVALVASFVSHNPVTAAELPALLASTHATLKELTGNDPGWHQLGGLRLASSQPRLEVRLQANLH